MNPSRPLMCRFRRRSWLFPDLRDERGVTFCLSPRPRGGGALCRRCGGDVSRATGAERQPRCAVRPPLHPYTPRPAGAVPTLDPHTANRRRWCKARSLIQPIPRRLPRLHPAARWPANVAAPKSLRRCARWPRAIGSPAIGSHPERGRWGCLFLNNRPIVRGSTRIYYPPRLVRRAINEAEHLCTLLPNGFGHFSPRPGAILPARYLAGRGRPSVKTQQWNCSSASRYPFPAAN